MENSNPRSESNKLRSAKTVLGLTREEIEVFATFFKCFALAHIVMSLTSIIVNLMNWCFGSTPFTKASLYVGMNLLESGIFFIAFHGIEDEKLMCLVAFAVFDPFCILLCILICINYFSGQFIKNFTYNEFIYR